MDTYRLFVFLHVLSAFTFLFMHGAPGLVAFRIRNERDAKKLQAMLEVYSTPKTFAFTYISLLLVLVFGIIAGSMGNFWSSGWIWTSVVIFILIAMGMSMMGTKYFISLRKAIGLPYREGKNEFPAGEPASQAEIDAILDKSPAKGVAHLGFWGTAIILYLMMFKPF